jgi:uncharacterized membrane protein YeaQ/YmgE (transglycosylase-associated protein family)
LFTELSAALPLLILIGLIIGVATSLIDKRQSAGALFGVLIVAVIGAIIGNFSASLLLGFLNTDTTFFETYFYSILGSITLLFISWSLKKPYQSYL